MSYKTVPFAAVAAACIAASVAAQAIPDGDAEAELQQKREAWFYGQRAYPLPHIPSGLRLQALAALTASEVSGAGTFSAGSPVWTFIGPKPTGTPYTFPVVSGRITALALDPRNPSMVVYAGAADGGVWKTTDGGLHWTPLTDHQNSLAIGSLLIDPANPDTVYAGTGEENFNGDAYYGAGILKSTNGGASWTRYPGPFAAPNGPDSFYNGGGRIGSLALQPGSSTVLLAAVQRFPDDGIYRSTDAGVHWKHVFSGTPATQVIFDPGNPSTAYAAVGYGFAASGAGIYKSTDGGLTWNILTGTGSNVLPTANVGRVALAMAPSNSSVLYAGIDDTRNSGLLGMYKTIDGGQNWTRLSSAPAYCAPQCWYDNVIAVHPTDANTVFAGGAFSITLVRSLDGGSTWRTVQSEQNFGNVHADVHALAFTPDGSQLFVGNDGGMYLTANPKAPKIAFHHLNTTLALTQFYPGMSLHPTNIQAGLGGTQDNGTQQYSGTKKWNQVTCGDGGFTAINPINPQVVYTTCELISIQKSTSGGGNPSAWQSAQNGINTSDPVQFIPPLVMDLSSPDRLYFGTNRVYQTTDGASSWTAISPDLTSGNGNSLTSVAVSPVNANTVWALSGDGLVHVTNNALSGTAAVWTNVTSSILPARFPTQIAASPVSATAAYLAFSGFSGFTDHVGHVFETTDGGQTWTDISGNLPNIPVNDIVADPDLANTVYAALDIGVYYTTNNGAAWAPLFRGLPRVAVLSLKLHEATRTLRAGSHGRGAWDVSVANVPGTK